MSVSFCTSCWLKKNNEKASYLRSSEQNLQKKSLAPYGSRAKIPGSCHVFGLESMDTFQESDVFLVCFSHFFENFTLPLWRLTTYCNDGRMPRRTVDASGSALPPRGECEGIFIAQREFPALAPASSWCFAMFSLAKKSNALKRRVSVSSWASYLNKETTRKDLYLRFWYRKGRQFMLPIEPWTFKNTRDFPIDTITCDTLEHPIPGNAKAEIFLLAIFFCLQNFISQIIMTICFLQCLRG